MNMPTASPPPNNPPDVAAKNNRWQRTGIGCAVALLVLAAGMVLAGTLWGPGALRVLMGAGVVAQLTPSPDAEQLAALRLTAEERLNSYGWVDPTLQIVHIPVEQAMSMLADSGLPVGVTPAPTPAAGAMQPESAPAAPAVDLTNVSFTANVLPIFEQHCAECHGDEKAEEGLKLIRYRSVMGGSQNGPVVEPGNPDNSYLVEMVVSGKMPKESDPLTQPEIDIIVAWITQGANEN
ncbi:MAG: hypothetical protein IPK16_14680 [Anaerolineales bacterium]|nr:hypothetical protein [Anaerolineales bacterium]